MPPEDLAQAKCVEEFVIYFLEELSKVFALQKTIEPNAIVFCTKKPDTLEPLALPGLIHMIAPDFEDEAMKSSFARDVRKLAFKTCAVGVLFVCECWMLQATPEERAQHHGSFKHHPKRQEVVLASLDHLAFPKSRSWRAVIARDAQGHGVLGPFEEQSNARATGRFTELFPRELYS